MKTETAAETATFTPGPWFVNRYRATIQTRDPGSQEAVNDPNVHICWTSVGHGIPDTTEANARLIAAAPTQHEEMRRYLPILERAEADADTWTRLTEGTGIATLNGYRAAIAKAEGEVPSVEQEGNDNQ